VHENDRSSLVSRLRSADGHLQAIIRMVNEGHDPEQILHQLSAVRAAVGRVQREILLRCLNDSLEIIKTETCPEKSTLEMERVYHLYRRNT